MNNTGDVGNTSYGEGSWRLDSSWEVLIGLGACWDLEPCSDRGRTAAGGSRNFLLSVGITVERTGRNGSICSLKVSLSTVPQGTAGLSSEPAMPIMGEGEKEGMCLKSCHHEITQKKQIRGI